LCLSHDRAGRQSRPTVSAETPCVSAIASKKNYLIA
jgi:hypothetical protein